jgi:hypothetical protein
MNQSSTRRVVTLAALAVLALATAFASSAFGADTTPTLKLHYVAKTRPNRDVKITATIKTSSRQGFGAYIMPLGQPCPTDDSEIPGTATWLIGQSSMSAAAYQFDESGRPGTFSHTWQVPSPEKPGTYSVCGYLAPNDILDDATYTGRLTVTTNTAAACVVPSLQGESLPSALAALTAAHCAVGNIAKIVPDKSVRKGSVVSTTVPVGRKLGNDARINLVVSDG